MYVAICDSSGNRYHLVKNMSVTMSKSITKAILGIKPCISIMF